MKSRTLLECAGDVLGIALIYALLYLLLSGVVSLLAQAVTSVPLTN